MRKTVLHDLYQDYITSAEHRITLDPEYIAVNREIERERRYFTEKMTPEDRERFQALDNLYTKANDYELMDAFTYAFKRAASLMCTVLTD